MHRSLPTDTCLNFVCLTHRPLCVLTNPAAVSSPSILQHVWVWTENTGLWLAQQLCSCHLALSCNYHMLFWKERLLVGYLSELWKNNPSALCPRLEEVQILGGCSYFTLKSACFSQFHWEVRVNHSSRSSSTLLLNINIIKTLSKSSSKTPHVVKAFLFYPVFITVVCEIFALIIYGSPPCMSCKAQSTWRKDFASVATQPWDQHVLRWWQAAVTS